MKNKLLISTFVLMLFATLLCSQVFATNNMMNSARNAANNAGGAISNAAVTTKDTIVNGTQNLINGTATLGNDMMNGMQNDTDHAVSTQNNRTTNGTTNGNYTATRTATGNTGLFGMSNTLSTWLILGAVAAVIIGLVWYYGAQYEHRNYNND